MRFLLPCSALAFSSHQFHILQALISISIYIYIPKCFRYFFLLRNCINLLMFRIIFGCVVSPRSRILLNPFWFFRRPWKRHTFILFTWQLNKIRKCIRVRRWLLFSICDSFIPIFKSDFSLKFYPGRSRSYIDCWFR